MREDALAPGIGLLCGCVPREPILAAGLRPVPVTGDEEGPADTELPHNLCAHVRRSASWLAGPGGAALAGVVLADGCYPMLRLLDLLRSREGFPRAWLLRVPRRRTPEGVRFLRDELLGLTRELGALPGARADAAERLGDAIAGEESRRGGVRRTVDSFLDEGSPGLTPERLARLAGTEGPDSPEAAPPPSLPGRERPQAGVRAPRLLLRGSYFVTPDLVRIVRGLGAAIHVLDSCAHDRPGCRPLAPPPGADPFEALAEWCLERPPCPRADAYTGAAERLADAGGIDGVVHLRMKHCTPQAYGLPLLADALREADVPVLDLEVDGPDWTQPRRTLRLEAFVESLRERIRAPR